jgi:hypothetical protein
MEWNYTANKWTLPDDPFEVVVTDTEVTLHRADQLQDGTVRISRHEGTLQGEVKSGPGVNGPTARKGLPARAGHPS